jgi:hypothetical protein
MSVSLTSLAGLPDILSRIASGDYVRAVALLQPYVVATSQQQRRESSSSLVVLYLYSSIQCEQYTNLVQWAEQLPNSFSPKEENAADVHLQRFLVAYAHYQLRQYARVVAMYKQQQSQTINDCQLVIAWEHLYAQGLYHLHSDRPRIVEIYDGLLLQQQESEMTMEYRLYTWTNLLAVLMAFYSIPYCSYIDPDDPFLKGNSDSDMIFADDPMCRVQPSINSHVSAIVKYVGMNSDAVSPDLVFNLASYLLPGITQQKQRRIWMERLQGAMERVADACTKEEDLPQYVKDVVPLHMNRTLFDLYFWSSTRRTMNGFTVFNHLSWTIRDMNAKYHKLLLPDNDVTLLAILPQQVRWVYRINQILVSPTNSTTIEVMITFLKEILSNEDYRHVLTNAQLHILYYTLALYYFYDQQYVECQLLCQHYFLSTATTKSKKKKQTAASNVANPIAAVYCSGAEQRFWECRATVLWAHCASSSDAIDRRDRLAALDRFCQSTLNQSSSRKVEDHVQLYARVHQIALKTKEAQSGNSKGGEEACSVLQSLPPSLRSKPAIQSTLRLLQRGSSTTDSADSNMSDTGKDIPTVQKVKDLVASIPPDYAETMDALDEIPNWIAYGDYAMSQTLYADAALLYKGALTLAKRRPLKKNDSSHPQYIQSLTAKCVCALSHVQPSAAVSLWSSMSVPPLLNEVNTGSSMHSGADLERKEIAFSNSSHVHLTSAGTTPAVPQDGAMVHKEKRRAARLRRRARQRELYVQTLPPNSRNSTPHPDRWRPRYERRAAQGGGTADAGALDVVARQANRDAQVKSTAHMLVSGGKGGKNKKRR